MDQKFHGLPPLKRFRLMQQQQQKDALLSPSRLPAKKRKAPRDQLVLPDPTASAAAGSNYSLPAKKRVWAFQPDLFTEEPLSTLDLNVEYKPPFGWELEEEAVEKLEEEKGEAENGCNEDIENTREEKSQEIAGDGECNEEEEDDADDGIVCAVCQSTDGDPSDPIVFCDGCNLMVHASCYGNPLIKGIPEGDWFCAQCAFSAVHSQSNESCSCCLCPVKGGAMKPTGDGRWAHIVCALYVPEVFFKDPEGREGIDCSKVPKRRWKERCYVCESSKGCAIQCSELKCPLAFHVSCGLNEDLCIEYKEGRNTGAIVAGFCKKHSDLWKKQEQTGKYKIVARED
ncbi:hypothetical protein ACFX19_031557 [Malus domestica]